MARVVIEHLTKTFKAPKGKEPIVNAVQDLSLAVESGELLVLVGPSGSGKTTTLRLLAGLEEPSQGSIFIDGVDVTKVSARERDVAMVFQHHALHPHMTVFENVAFPLTIRKTPKAEIDRRVREMGELLELGDCLGRAPAEISGGQRQRVALGRALVRRPKLLLLDEPLSNLDAPLRAQMRRLIARLNGNLGCTMVYVTHDQTEAMMLGKRLAVMNGGMLQQIDEPQQIYRTPGNVFVAGFVGWPPMNLLSGRLVRRGTDLFFEQQSSNNSAGLVLKLNASGPGEMQTSENRQVMLGIRPEDVRNGQAVQNGAIEGVVSAIEPAGAVTFLYLEAGHSAIVAAVSADESVRLKEKRTFGVDTNRIHLFDAETGERLKSDQPPQKSAAV